MPQFVGAGMQQIPRDSEGKTVGQRDRETRQATERQQRFAVGVVVALLVLTGAGIALAACAGWLRSH